MHNPRVSAEAKADAQRRLHELEEGGALDDVDAVLNDVERGHKVRG
jgi:hypothetical protein